MAFHLRCWVKIKELQKCGEITKILKSGFYEVTIGSLKVRCKERDLIEAERPGSITEKGKHSSNKKKQVNARALTNLKRLDLHGLTIAEALRRVEDHLNQSILVGLDRLDIIHGHGTGRIKKALHEYLLSSAVVREFKLDENNSGMTRVYL